MEAQQRAIAKECLAGAENDSMTFPQIVGRLMAAGFEGYSLDLRRSLATYHLPSGEGFDLPAHKVAATVAPALDTAALQAAIREAQTLAPGYSYRGFCAKAVAAGCAGYIVSFPGRRAVYFGRTAEVHTEHFPPA